MLVSCHNTARRHASGDLERKSSWKELEIIMNNTLEDIWKDAVVPYKIFLQVTQSHSRDSNWIPPECEYCRTAILLFHTLDSLHIYPFILVQILGSETSSKETT
jgi:hypothetical protein